MEPNEDLEKYAKAKIEEPDLRLPKAMMKFNTDSSAGELCYMKIFEEDTQKAKHLAEEIAAGAKPDRKVYRIRNMELFKAIGENFEDMKQIHRVSKATIGLLVDGETDRHCHSYIDLMGSVEQVQMAEKLILDKIIRTYNGPVYPVILMPPTIYGYENIFHLDKLKQLAGENNSNIVAIEVVSGAWIQIDNKPPPGGKKRERLLSIYGPRAHVVKALSLVNSSIYEPGESIEAEKELEELFKELSFGEMMEGMKPRIRELSGQFGSFKKESASGSGQTEEQKHQQHEEDVEGSQDESKEKKQEQKVEEDIEGSQDESKEKKQEQKLEEDIERSQDESKEKKQKIEEDVEKVISVEASQQDVQKQDVSGSH